MNHVIRFFTVSAVCALGAIALSAGTGAQPSEIDEKFAKRVAKSHISDLGYQYYGRSSFSARIDKGRLEDNIWRFNVRYGGTLPSYSGYVMVSALTGRLIDSNVPSGCEIVTATNVIIVGGCR